MTKDDLVSILTESQNFLQTAVESINDGKTTEAMDGMKNSIRATATCLKILQLPYSCTGLCLNKFKITNEVAETS